MRILDVLCAPWAILPTRLTEIQDLYVAHTRREKIDLKAWEAASGRPAGSDRAPYEIRDGVAILPLQGVLTKPDSAWNRFCGMTSTAQSRSDLQTALEDPNVQSILIWIDSPGGTVDGTQELADAVFAARDVKPIVTLADGCMCSAALWIGTAASKVFISSGTTEVGSIGVVADHVDVSRQDEQQGRKVTHVTFGKYKRITTPHAPLSQEGLAVMQDTVDYLGSIFIDEIAKFRGVSVETVLADMADARIFIGQQAIDAGLVDGVSTMDALIQSLSEGRVPLPTGAGAALDSQTPSLEASMPITREALAAQDGGQNLITALIEEGKTAGVAAAQNENKTAIADAAANATTAETARVKGCLEAVLPGHEKLALTLALDGKTTPAEAALAINAAERQARGAARKEIEGAGPAPIPTAGDPGSSEGKVGPSDAKAHAAAITAHITAEAAKGRRITAEQASQELLKGKE